MTEETKSQENFTTTLNVLISGAAGQIGYSLIPLVATGLCFGPNVRVNLRLLDIEPMMEGLKGVVMEIEDCAYPLVESIVPTFDVKEAFTDVDFAILVGGFPRRPGMLRKDLLGKNAPIFKSMGEALEKYARETCRVLVVANPANTNCLTAIQYAPKIPKQNWCALTRLDQNRATQQIAKKLNLPTSSVSNVVIWGNHSSTQVPDIDNALVNINSALQPVRLDNKWVNETFRKTVQQRGKAIIQARKKSSSLSAANAIKDCVYDWYNGTSNGRTVAMAVYSNGEYGIQKGIIYSFPCVCTNGTYQIVQNLQLSDTVQKLMKDTEKELCEEAREAGIKL